MQPLLVNNSQQSMLLALPPDLIRLTAAHLDDDSKVVCRFVCRRFRDLVYIRPVDRQACFHQSTWFTVSLASKGYLNVLQWARGQRAPYVEEQVIEIAASIGHLHVLEWAVATKLSTKSSLMRRCIIKAAQCGQIRILDWLINNGYRSLMESCACEYAAFGCQLDTLKWLRAHEVTWDIYTCRAAVEKGDLNALQWARANGAPWNVANCIQEARRRGDEKMLAWINGNR